MLKLAGTRLRSAKAEYVLHAPLARGGGSEVWSARSTDAPEIPLAIKLSALDLSTPRLDPLQQERALLSLCTHPLLVSLADPGGIHSATGHSWLVMGHVQGPPCTQVPSASAAQLAKVLSCMSRLLGALEYLHQLGWVHADLKPSHVRLDSQGQVRLLDLGSATAVGACNPAQEFTPNYAAPEQLLGKSVDARTDLYAWASVFYEWLCGQRQAPAWRTQQACTPVQRDVSLFEAPMHLPAHAASALGAGPRQGLEQILRTCLAARPEQRYSSAAVVQAKLDAVIANS